MLIQQFGSDLQFQQSHRPSVKEINAANLQVIFSHNQIYLLYKSIKIRLSNIFLLVKHTSSIDILKWKILPAEYRPSFSAFNTIVKILNLYILLIKRSMWILVNCSFTKQDRTRACMPSNNQLLGNTAHLWSWSLSLPLNKSILTS